MSNGNVAIQHHGHLLHRIIALHDNCALVSFHRHNFPATHFVLDRIIRQLKQMYEVRAVSKCSTKPEGNQNNKRHHQKDITPQRDKAGSASIDIETAKKCKKQKTATTEHKDDAIECEKTKSESSRVSRSCDRRRDNVATSTVQQIESKVYVKPHTDHEKEIFTGLFCLKNLCTTIFGQVPDSMTTKHDILEDMMSCITSIALYNMGTTLHVLALQHRNNNQIEQSQIIFQHALTYYERSYRMLTIIHPDIKEKNHNEGSDRPSSCHYSELLLFVKMALCLNMSEIKSNPLLQKITTTSTNTATACDDPMTSKKLRSNLKGMIQLLLKKCQATNDRHAITNTTTDRHRIGSLAVSIRMTSITIRDLNFFCHWYMIASRVVRDNGAAAA
jgi:hypothetical protein